MLAARSALNDVVFELLPPRLETATTSGNRNACGPTASPTYARRGRLLRDLQDLRVLGILVQTIWTAIAQAAQGPRDRDLIALAQQADATHPGGCPGLTPG
jgi:hypothetical protein